MSLKFIACIYSFFVLLIAEQSRQAEVAANQHDDVTDVLEGSDRSGRKENTAEQSQPISPPWSHLLGHTSLSEYSPFVSGSNLVYSQRIPNSFSTQSGAEKDRKTSGRNKQISDDPPVNPESEKSVPSAIYAAPATHPSKSSAGFEPSKRSHPWGPYHVRGDNYNRGVGLSHSDSNVDWSIWEAEPPTDSGMKKPKGGMMPSPPPGPSYHHFHHFDKIWKDDPWKDMTPMMMMPDMMMMKGGMMPDDKRKSLLDKLGSLDAMKVLLVGAIPLSLILAAILPTLMNMMMNNHMNPTISTIATGSSGRELEKSVLEPIMKVMADLQSTPTGESHCFQKMFCKAATGSELSNPAKDVFYKASALVEDRWLEAFGLKSLMQAIAVGKCESINCPPIKRVPKKVEKEKDNNQQKRIPLETLLPPKHSPRIA